MTSPQFLNNQKVILEKEKYFMKFLIIPNDFMIILVSSNYYKGKKLMKIYFTRLFFHF